MNTIDFAFYLERPTRTYSDNRLNCHGRACATCGWCRDWHHNGHCYNNCYYYDYKKRNDATCRGTQYVDHDGPGHLVSAHNCDATVEILCACSDNI